MIIYSSTLDSFLKAAFLSFVTGNPICSPDELKQGIMGLFQPLRADDYSWEDIFRQFSAKGCLPPTWLKEQTGQELRKLIFYSLRHCRTDKIRVCLKAVHRALKSGPETVLYRLCREGRELHRYAGEVGREIYRMTALLRFTPFGDHHLAAELNSEYQIVDLVLQRLARRYPGHTLVLIQDNLAVSLGKDRQLVYQDAAPFFAAIQADSFRVAWKTYYTSQYIPARRNLALAKKCLPKKYWFRLTEGELLAAEEKQQAGATSTWASKEKIK